MFNCERSEVSESSEFIYRKYRNLCIGIVDRQRIKWLEMVLFYSFYVLVFIYKVDLARSWRSLTAYISDRITSFDTNAFKANSKQKDIKQGDTSVDINAFTAHSKQ